MTPPVPVVDASRASAVLGGRTIWEEVELKIGAGQFVAVLGPNGAGKSTLIKAILGLVPLASGRISVLGRDPRAARPHVGYLPQRRSFEQGVRIRGVDLVRLGLDGARWGLPLPGQARWSERGRRAAARVDEVIALVGAEPYATQPIGSLSGGEQQRLLIAQALVRRPRLLLLDEPLDSLDLPNQAGIAALVSSICRAVDVSALLVAHDVNPVLPYLDSVVYLASGRSVTGPIDQVITTATLTGLYGAPVEVLRTSDGRRVVVGQPEAPSLHGDRHEH